MTRVVLYARFSSDIQNPASVADQLHSCREFVATREDWMIVGIYCDEAISAGSQLVLPGVRGLLLAAQRGEFDMVLAEGLDRINRNQSLVASLYEQLQFAGVRMVTLAEGPITELHIGFKGTMNALFLKDMAIKVRRGQQGRILEGKSAGGLSYGYDVVKHVDADGEPIRGDRQINPTQAEVVRRVLREFASGVSPREIAKRLNKDGIPGPSGGLWTDSTIRGQERRGLGLINNQLYIGKLVWNRQNFPKNPITGKNVSRFNPPEKWVTTEVPTLRIVDDELWTAVKARQAELSAKYATIIAGTLEGQARARALHGAHRPRTLLSGLLKCGHCGGPYVMRGQDRYGCANHNTKDSCSNRRTICREELENRVLAGLRGPLMEPEVVAEAMRAYTEEISRLNRERNSSYNSAAKLLSQAQKKIQEITRAIEDGGYSRALNERLRELEAREAELAATVSAAPPMEICIPPIEAFRSKVERLAEALRCPEERDEAFALIRGLIDHIKITPGPKWGGAIDLELHGDIASILERIACCGGAIPEMSVSVKGGCPYHRDRQLVIVAI